MKRMSFLREELQTARRTGMLWFQVKKIQINMPMDWLIHSYAVLLRVLEYYQGIMILTTNRITSLDVAVQSRIHLAIRYEDLSEDYKAAIFNMFLDQLDKQEPESIKDRGSINDWIEEYGRVAKLNGRQIRNVISAALALARSKEEIKANKGDERLTVKHIKRVVRITHDFQEQLESVTTASRMLNEVKGGSK